MGLHRPEVITQKVDAIPGLCGEGRERRQRNYERVWLGIFIADKSFGIATGRPICVSWRELMPDVGDWWRKKWAKFCHRDRAQNSEANFRRANNSLAEVGAFLLAANSIFFPNSIVNGQHKPRK